MSSFSISSNEAKGMLFNIIRDLALDSFTPDLIVGINATGMPADGVIPARLLAEYYDVEVEYITVDFNDKDNPRLTTMCHIPESVVESELRVNDDGDTCEPMNVLVVLGYNDTNLEINWLKDDWESVVNNYGDFNVDKKKFWRENIWGKTVRFAALVNNWMADANRDVSYYGEQIGSYGEHEVEFPWNEWWSKE